MTPPTMRMWRRGLTVTATLALTWGAFALVVELVTTR